MNDKEKCFICGKDMIKQLPKIDADGNYYCNDCYSAKCKKELEEKQILAIVQDLSDCLEYNIEDSSVVDIYDTACKLANKGWVKLPKDSVVLSREEYTKNILTANKDGMEGGKAIGSKETAKKIFTEVLDLEQLKVIRDMGWEKVYNTLYNETLELAKQLAVEIKE